jgi:hypothetical protein
VGYYFLKYGNLNDKKFTRHVLLGIPQIGDGHVAVSNSASLDPPALLPSKIRSQWNLVRNQFFMTATEAE